MRQTATLLLFLCLILSSCIFKCEQREKIQYSLALDYKDINPTDPVLLEGGSYLVQFYDWGINRKTLEEVIEMYGEPDTQSENRIDSQNIISPYGWESGDISSRCLFYVLQKCKAPLTIYSCSWETPWGNSDNIRYVYFIRDSKKKWRAIWGENMPKSNLLFE